MAKPPPVEKEQLVLTVQVSELLIRNMQPTRIAWIMARTDKAIRIGRMARQPQQNPHQLNTMQQKAMKAARPVVILVILIMASEKVQWSVLHTASSQYIFLCRTISSSTKP